LSQKDVAIYALTAPAAAQARRLASAWPQARLFLPRRLAEPAAGELAFDGLGRALADNFRRYEGHVLFAAAGMVVRCLVGLLQGKDQDPAVVVADPEGRYAVSLLSGHLGGANELARQVAQALGGQAVITTATDNAGQPSLEMTAREQGLRVENLKALARVSRELVEGGQVPLYDPEGWLWPALAQSAGCFRRLEAPPSPAAVQDPAVLVAWRGLDASPAWLIMRPPCLAVGLGCNRGASAQEMRELMELVLHQHGLAVGSVFCLATVEAKRDEAGITRLAEELGIIVRYYPAHQLREVAVPNPSPMARRHMGTESVCEAAALLAAGADRLLVTKQKTKNATLAVAKLAGPGVSS